MPSRGPDRSPPGTVTSRNTSAHTAPVHRIARNASQEQWQLLKPYCATFNGIRVCSAHTLSAARLRAQFADFTMPFELRQAVCAF
jgi:hypothetical protein